MRKKIFTLLETMQYDKIEDIFKSEDLGILEVNVRTEIMLRRGQILACQAYLEETMTHSKDRSIVHLANAILIRVNTLLGNLDSSDQKQILSDIEEAEQCDCEEHDKIVGEIYLTYAKYATSILSDLNLSVQYRMKAIEIFRSLENYHMIFYVRNRMGIDYKDHGYLNKAMLIFQDNFQLAGKIMSSRAQMITLGNIASLKVEEGNLEEAEQTFQEILHVVKNIDEYNRGVVMMKLGVISRLKGEFKKSLQQLEEADKLLSEVGILRAENLVNLALTDIAMGNIQQSHIDLQLAIDVSQKGNYHLPLAISTYLTIRADNELDDINDILEQLEGGENIQVTLFTNLIRSLLLMKQSRAFTKIQALLPLKENMKHLKVNLFAAIETLVLSTEVLILEYSMTGSEESIQEIQKMMNHLVTLAIKLPKLHTQLKLLTIKLDYTWSPKKEKLQALSDLETETDDIQILHEIEEFRKQSEEQFDRELKMISDISEKGKKILDELKKNEILDYLKYIAKSNIDNMFVDV